MDARRRSQLLTLKYNSEEYRVQISTEIYVILKAGFDGCLHHSFHPPTPGRFSNGVRGYGTTLSLEIFLIHYMLKVLLLEA